jgi:hypothetical protein
MCRPLRVFRPALARHPLGDPVVPRRHTYSALYVGQPSPRGMGPESAKEPWWSARSGNLAPSPRTSCAATTCTGPVLRLDEGPARRGMRRRRRTATDSRLRTRSEVGTTGSPRQRELRSAAPSFLPSQTRSSQAASGLGSAPTKLNRSGPSHRYASSQSP